MLGSGLGALTEALEDRLEIPYAEIEGMPQPSVAGHGGKLVLGRLGGATVACLQGRVHLYEGHPAERVVYGVRLLAALRCHSVLLTNAAGSLREGLAPGQLLLLRDHLNLTGDNPLVAWHPKGSPTFVDMSRAYHPALLELARRAAQQARVPLSEGVYAGLLGPSYETPAEVRMLGQLGADAVGMSTVHEVIALAERGVRVGAVSCITNMAAGLPGAVLNHEHVQQTALRARDDLMNLMTHWITLIAENP